MSSDGTQAVAATVSPPATGAEANKNLRSSRSRVLDFKGIGRKGAPPDTGFRHEISTAPDLNADEDEGIKLSPGMQKIADGAGRTLKNINNAVLDTVRKPFELFGLDAESAKMKPSHGGVGLDVSINLEKKKKDAAKADSTKKNDSQEFYDLLKPDDDRSRK